MLLFDLTLILAGWFPPTLFVTFFIAYIGVTTRKKEKNQIKLAKLLKQHEEESSCLFLL